MSFASFSPRRKPLTTQGVATKPTNTTTITTKVARPRGGSMPNVLSPVKKFVPRFLSSRAMPDLAPPDSTVPPSKRRATMPDEDHSDPAPPPDPVDSAVFAVPKTPATMTSTLRNVSRTTALEKSATMPTRRSSGTPARRESLRATLEFLQLEVETSLLGRSPASKEYIKGEILAELEHQASSRSVSTVDSITSAPPVLQSAPAKSAQNGVASAPLSDPDLDAFVDPETFVEPEPPVDSIDLGDDSDSLSADDCGLDEPAVVEDTRLSEDSPSSKPSSNLKLATTVDVLPLVKEIENRHPEFFGDDATLSPDLPEIEGLPESFWATEDATIPQLITSPTDPAKNSTNNTTVPAADTPRALQALFEAMLCDLDDDQQSGTLSPTISSPTTSLVRRVTFDSSPVMIPPSARPPEPKPRKGSFFNIPVIIVTASEIVED